MARRPDHEWSTCPVTAGESDPAEAPTFPPASTVPGGRDSFVTTEPCPTSPATDPEGSVADTVTIPPGPDAPASAQGDSRARGQADQHDGPDAPASAQGDSGTIETPAPRTLGGRNPGSFDTEARNPFATTVDRDSERDPTRTRDPYATADHRDRDPYATADHDARDPYATADHRDRDPYATADHDPYATADRDADGAPRPEPPPFEGPRVPGHDLLARLGRGGMGVVYKARHRQLNRLVALKMIRAAGRVTAEQLARFQNEAQTVAQLHHVNVVQIYEVGQVDGLPFLSLELLEGGTLADRLAKAPLTARRAAELMVTLARAIHAAHEHGIIHRDLKPLNVLFDTDGTPKIGDFGLAKRVVFSDGSQLGSHGDSDDGSASASDGVSGESQTLTGQVMGSPCYMAPEQARGLTHEVGPLADVYALGAILYEVLTGRPPFKGASRAETIQLVVTEDPVPPSRLQPKTPRDLETICLKCLAKDPQKRYASARELAEDLGRYLNDEPVLARPTPAWERTVKWIRRNPQSAALLGFAAVLLVALFAGALGYQNYVNEEKRKADLRVAQQRLELGQELSRGREQQAHGRLDEARVTLNRLLARVQGQPRLSDLAGQARGVLAAVEEELDRRDATEAARRRLAEFNKLHDDAFFYDIPFTGLDLDRKLERTRAAARAALDLGAARGPGDTWSPRPPFDRWLSETERSEVAEGCYELLLILAEAVAQPLPGEDPRRQADQALAILDQASAWHDTPTRAYYLRRAACLERRGDPAAADVRRQAERTAPRGAVDHFLTGRERYERRDWAGALRHFDAALQDDPDLFWAHCLSAVCHLNSLPPQPAAAKEALTVCLQARPDLGWLYILRGTAYGEMGAVLQAASDRRQGRIVPSPDAVAEFDAAEADFRQALARTRIPELRYALFMNRGTVRFQRNQLDRAAADFQQAVALKPEGFNGYVALAQVDQKRGRFDAAIEDLGQAIARQPEMAQLYRARALVRKAQGQTPPELEAALNDFEAAIRHAGPDRREAAEDQILRGEALLKLERPEPALAAFNAALALADDAADAHAGRVMALLRLRRFKDLLTSCDAALARGALTPEFERLRPDFLKLRGLALEADRSDVPGAIAAFSQALALRPDWPEVLALRGNAYLRTEAPLLALGDFERVVQLEPTKADGYLGRGAALVQLGRTAEAVADAERALRRGPRLHRLTFLAAQTYAQAARNEMVGKGREGHPDLRSAHAYEARATALTRRAFEETPAAERVSFWHDVIQKDRAMTPIVRRLRLIETRLPITTSSR